ncbi:MAG: SDR family oxidoreductase [Massilia sp.]|uniref:SDR family oxidoreductase n=1 Tax=Massilia sp. TaxID=1882437 RepID=UPI0019AF2573|nr:SDR family oxidoreductase [Oxalobacteraceae sp. CFBP 8753]MBD8630930.1 SDR family oxidoreductase [Oxalobacteraceae sp. CFBP 8755]
MHQSHLRVVIMGGSSGIGAATAIAFARQGAHLVLGARGKDGLDDIARRCRQAGGHADVLVVDATDADAVAAFAQDARDLLGQIDLWFSNVGSGVVGKFADVPIAHHRQVIETNLITHMNDAHAVMPIFLEQNYGIWVNMISSGGFVAMPYASAYGASKFGLRGFSEALRAELGKQRDIHVCDIYPTFVDTPGFHHVANYTGARLSYPPGVLAPEKVADAVVALVRKPRPVTVLGAPDVTKKLTQLAPDLIASGMNRFMETWARRADPTGNTVGALYEPQQGASGVHSGMVKRPARPRRDIPSGAPSNDRTLAVGAVLIAAAIGVSLLGKRSGDQSDN